MGPPFFIVGSARSGTTLLRLMLNAHPEVGIPPESRFITELYDGRDEVDTSAFLTALAAHKRFKLWGLPIEAVTEALPPGRAAYAVAAGAPFAAWAQRRGKPRWGDKTPRYVEHVPLLARLWPGARFVHLIRDGRNVALSYADVSFGPKTVAAAAALWARRVRGGMDDGRALGTGRYTELRYEDLVGDPESHARRLCDFLELDFDPGMLDHGSSGGDLVMPWATQGNPNILRPATPGLRAWEGVMPPAQVEVFEALAGDLLAELGYPRRFASPSGAARLRAGLGRAGLPVGRLRSSRS